MSNNMKLKPLTYKELKDLRKTEDQDAWIDQVFASRGVNPDDLPASVVQSAITELISKANENSGVAMPPFLELPDF